MPAFDVALQGLELAPADDDSIEGSSTLLA